MEEADLVTGSTDRRGLLERVQRVLDSGERLVEIAPHERGEAFEELPMERFEYEYEGQTNEGFGLIFGQVRELGVFGRLREGFLITADFVRTVWMSLGSRPSSIFLRR